MTPLVDVVGLTKHYGSKRGVIDLSFQHASASILRAMRRFGDVDTFLGLVESVREKAPRAGIRSNVIVGFPGETDNDCAELDRFLVAAKLDVVGVFGYSNEDGTAAATREGQHSTATVAERVEYFSRLVEELTTQRAEDRVGEPVRVLVEEVDESQIVGRAAHQGPDVDGQVVLTAAPSHGDLRVGQWFDGVAVAADGVDLHAELV